MRRGTFYVELLVCGGMLIIDMGLAFFDLNSLGVVEFAIRHGHVFTCGSPCSFFFGLVCLGLLFWHPYRVDHG